ncbi:ATP-binding protein [Chitinophaga sp. 22321]|uniref:histidine kinase n=1 Tax=Chitinophaga hostae TaxID=2831022 RepID=A0ABS5IVG2_9BACT|nr:ATP-binding protein [Chitinophaga hostae]MBS0026947.1 response regulator [Chitinophaga hostae]
MKNEPKSPLDGDNNLLAFLQYAPMGAFCFDAADNCIFINPAMEDISGLTLSESLGQGYTKTIFPEDIEALKAALLTTSTNPGHPISLSFRIHHPVKGTRYCRVNSWIVPGKKGIAPYRIGYVQDETDELILKSKLTQSNGLLDFSQALGKTGGWEYHLETGEIFWSRETYRINEVPEDFIPSIDTIYALHDEASQQILQERVREAIENGTPYDIELRLVTNDAHNSRKWVRAMCIPILRDGKVVTLKGAIMDISEKKRDEQALIKAREAAEKSARDKFDFLSTMSHEIRTPLNGIIGITHLLKMNYHPAQEEFIDGLIYSSEHLLQLINDIMDLNRIETENLELHFSEVDLTQLIQQIKGQLSQQATEKGLWLNSVVDLNMPRYIMADPIRISQILNNLISNAIKYTEKGEISVSVLITAETDNHVTLRFSVKDTGIGIPAELQEMIFERFRHLHTTSSHRLSGSGLGLAITRRLIAMLGGRILLESSPGKGSRFYFDLTFEKAAPKAADDKSLQNEISAYAGKFSWLQVLLVEDTSVNIMVADNQLKYFGIIPDVATNGNDAASLLQSITYDVALIDLHMPGMDGYALGKLIKERYPHIQVVIFTADILADVRTRFTNLDITHFLNKPFLPEEMLAILLKITHERKK